MRPLTLRMRFQPKLEGDEVPRLNPKVGREPFPEQRPREMSSKYTLSWAFVPMCAHEGEAGGEDGTLVEKHLRAESSAEIQQMLCLPVGTN